MTKISQYSTDNNIRGNDKWIGSDSQNYLMTKNFTPNKLADYFNGNNVIDIGTSIRYTYQTLDPGELRAQGTISFETEIGPQVNFSDITTFLLAKNTLKGNTVSQYLNLLVDSKVLLSKSSNINVYGYYKITSIEPWIPDTNFFVVTVDFLSGNGFIYEDLDYLISLVDKISALPSTTIWGDITGDILNQTDLIDYISDNYYPIPTGTTLQYVRGDGSLATFPSVTPSALTKTDDTNVTLTLGGSPNTALLAGVSLTLGWTGTLADNRIASAATWNAKLDGNPAITGATKTKITYDSKGLVTSGADATTADITDSTNKRYVTDAQLVVIGNTSGTNTGDETNATIKTKLGAASTSTEGYLTSTDWNTFNGKQSALSGTGVVKSTAGTISYISGTSSQFIKGDGSLDSNTYLTSASLSGYVPYTGATTTLNLGANDINAQGIRVTGVNGNGHLTMRWQSVDPISQANHTTFFADSLGNFKWKNDNAYYTTLKTDANTANRVYTFPNRDITIDNITTSTTSNGTGFIKSNGTSIIFDNSTYITLGSLSSTATGLTYTNTTGVFSLTSGYVIPTTTEQSNWNTAYTNIITSLTTTGSSGSATLSSNTLNIPTYTLSGLGGVSTGRTLTINGTALDLSADRSWSVGTVTSVAALTIGTSGTDITSTVATGTTTPVITLNVPTASATNRGVLSSTDWTTFNNKQNALSYTPYRFIQTSQTAHTGTTAETIMATATINGGTFNSGDVMKVFYGLNKGTTTGAATMRIRINTSNTLSGAVAIGQFTLTATGTANIMKRNFMLNGGNLYGINFATTSIISDEVNTAATYTSTAYNTANTLFVFFTIQLANSGDSVTPNLFNIIN